MRDRARETFVGIGLGILIGLGLWGCSGSGGDGARAEGDTLTQRQKDSIVSTLPVPGADAVGRALDAADAARARAERHDTMG